MNKIILTSIAIASALTLSTSTFAAEAFAQAGDIAEGKSFNLDKSAVASYYKEGKSGEVTFFCNLTGKSVNAALYPGKNFLGANLPRFLSEGGNGPYTWKLYDRGDTVGNIKVKLIRGDNAVVQCQQLS